MTQRTKVTAQIFGVVLVNFFALWNALINKSEMPVRVAWSGVAAVTFGSALWLGSRLRQQQTHRMKARSHFAVPAFLAVSTALRVPRVHDEMAELYMGWLAVFF